MKKLIITVTLAVFCGSFVNAQTSTVAKKATLMPEGAVITDLKTGEVVRTVKGGVSISDIERSIINLIDPQNGNPGKTVTTPGLSNTNNTNSSKTNGTQPTNQTPKKD